MVPVAAVLVVLLVVVFVVSPTVGDSVSRVGAKLGFGVLGLSDGNFVGLAVGTVEGAKLGFGVLGLSDGNFVGLAVGTADG